MAQEAPGNDRVMQADAPSPDELLQSALEYARRGFGVFPLHTPINGVCDCPRGPECGSPGKHPRTANGLKDASRDELQVRRWWKTYPIANIGMAVPEGYVVVDVDGPEGQEALRDHARALPPTAVQTTGRGAHYVYRTLDRIPPRSNLLPKVDLRGPGSYIVAAPSVHASGAVYGWEIPLEATEAAPRWLAEVGQKSGGTTEGPRAPVDFELVLAGLPEGQRKWEIYRAASKLRAAEVPMDLAVMLARQAAERCTPPLEAAEAERKVKEAYAKYPPNASARDLPAEATLLGADSVMIEFEEARFVFSDLEKQGRELHAEMEVLNLLPGTPREPYIQRLNLLSMSARESCRREVEQVLGTVGKGHWTALLARAVAKAQAAYLNVDRSIRFSDIEAPETLGFVIPDLVAEDGMTILFGAGSAGKTWLLMKAALAVSRGDPFLGRPCQQRNVLYFDCETRQRTAGYRMRRICVGEGLDQDAAVNVHYWYSNGIPLEDQIDALKRKIDADQIGFICLDHIAAACSGDAAEQLTASRFARAHGKLGDIPMLALAHITGAAVNDPEQAKRPFGSVFWENNARRTVFVAKQQEQQSPVADLGLYPRKVNDGGQPGAFGVTLGFTDPDGPITVDPSQLRGSGQLSRYRGPEYTVWDALTGPMTADDLVEATGLSMRAVKGALLGHPRMFVDLDPDSRGGRGKVKRWGRLGRSDPTSLPYADDDDVAEVPF